MPRAPNEKMIEAEKLFHDGVAMVEIAKKLGVSDGTVRSWKNRHGWSNKSKKKKRNVAKKEDKKSATLQKRRRGGQPGNTNAKGNKGNPNPKPPPDVTKHGGYRVPMYIDKLDEDEQELVATVPEDTEAQLMEEIQLFSIRERRLLGAINQYRKQKGDVAVADVTRIEDKRTFKSEEEEAVYDRIQNQKVDKGKILPGKTYNLQTHTINKDMIIARLEQELSTVQSKKTKAIEALSKYRMEKAKMESESAGNAAVDDWITAILGEDLASDE